VTAELVPAAKSPADIAEMPPEQRGQLITRALVESRSWLAVATKGTDPTPIAHFKAWAATVAEMTRQKGLAEEIQLDALEMVRRAERGIGLAIRNGQEAGEIKKRGQHTGNQYTRGKHDDNRNSIQRPVTDFASADELTGNNAGIYHLTDGVTDDQFEEALADAREERNLSRTNIRRKIVNAPTPSPNRLPRAKRLEQIRERAERGLSSYQIGEALGIDPQRVRALARQGDIKIPADAVMLRVKHTIDPAHVIRTTVEEIAGSIDATWQFLKPGDFAGLDPNEVREWISSLNASMRAIRNLQKELTHSVQH
jgi:hypothetical protein